MYDDDQLEWQDANESAVNEDFVKWCADNDIDFDGCGQVEQWEIRDEYFNWLTNEREDQSIYTARL
jgi:hypothetical protein